MEYSFMPSKHRFAVSFVVALGVVGPMLPSIASAGLSDAVSDARKQLARAIKARDPDAVRAAAQKFVSIGGEKSISTLLKILPSVPDSEEGIYWTLIGGACSYVDREAMEYLGEVFVKGARSGIARDLLYGLSKNRSIYALWALRPLLEKGPRDLQILALQKIAKIPIRKSVDVLIATLKREEESVRDPSGSQYLWDIAEALTEITGQNFGPTSINWEGWWAKNRETATLGGEPVDDEDEDSVDGGDEDFGGTVVRGLKRRRKEEFFGLENAPKLGVVVLSAYYEDPPVARDLNNDHIEDVLSRMGVPHTIVFRKDFQKFDLGKTGALVINCAQFHEFCICPTCIPGGEKNNRLYRCTGCNKHVKFSAGLSREAIKKIVDFVRRGGFVFGEDWVVKEVLEKAFPRYVAAGEVLRNTLIKSVDVVPARGMVTHPYLRGIFIAEKADTGRDDGDGDGGDDDNGGDDDDDDGPTVVKKPEKKKGEKKGSGGRLVRLKHRWAIDDESWAFDLLDRNKVLVLMSSGELQNKANGQGVVAFAFRPGGKASDIGKSLRAGRAGGAKQGGRPGPGVVLQVLSHFGKQGNRRDEHLLQNILLNFLIDANVERTRRNGPDPRKKTQS